MRAVVAVGRNQRADLVLATWRTRWILVWTCDASLEDCAECSLNLGPEVDRPAGDGCGGRHGRVETSGRSREPAALAKEMSIEW